ncbi:hypothetical protein [Pontibacter actiniarum]|uniref:SH3 domain-containing protein n=1 Tax=Pontibacter actiniarum TaxID=323450 RepID=A0A1X9YV52_9BACT|nr:hypothetical protein [Pontibacter actiniarum]ARS36758.1 hypothetical protein CA264_15760 [Pontibacter actiniarum]
MKNLFPFTLALLCLSACSGNKDTDLEDEQATVASETGAPTPLAPDVLYATKPLISSKLYSQPDFQASSLAYFDTAQQINVLDTAHAMFVKARIRQDTTTITGYVPKTILPERKK